MGQHLSNHEYIEKVIINLLWDKKISKLEGEKLAQIMLSFNQQDWQNLKIIGQKAAYEYPKKAIENAERAPEHWKSPAKELSRAVINFVFALISEEFIAEAVQCGKEKIPLEQIPSRLAPLLTKQMKVMASRKSVSTSVDYRTEKSLMQKIKTGRILFFTVGESRDYKEAANKIKKILDLIKSLTPGEVKVLKERGKEELGEIIDEHAKNTLEYYPFLKDLVPAAVELVDALADETLGSEVLKMAAELVEIVGGQIIKNPAEIPNGFKAALEFGFKNAEVIFEEVKRRGLENRLLKLAQNLTQHLNLLAGKESPISATAEAEIMQKLQPAKTEYENNDNSEEENNSTLINLRDIISSLEDKGGSKGPLAQLDLGKRGEKLLDKLSNITEPAWYQTTWGIVLMIGGALVLGGFISWLIFRRREKPIREEKEED